MTTPTNGDSRACACGAAAEFYWHDAGPFGAGTFYGCAAHAPSGEGVERLARAEHTYDPGFGQQPDIGRSDET